MGETAANKLPSARWMRIIPVCMIVNIFCFMDRGIISMALPGGMAKDLAMDATTVGFAAGIAALGLMLLQVPAGCWAQKEQAKKFVAWSIVAWGALTLATGFVQTTNQLLIVRFLLGVAEGGVSPAILTLLTYWFPDKGGERNRANSAFMTGISLALMLMGPIAGMAIGTYGWRGLFIGLGVVSLLCGLLWVAFISERPEKANWLSKEEKDYITSTISAEREIADQKSTIEVKGNKLPLGKLLRDRNVILLCIISICVNIGQFGFGMWIPTIIKSVTNSGILGVGLLFTVVNFCTLTGLWTWSYITKRANDRRLCTGVPMLLFGASLFGSTFISGNPMMSVVMIGLVSFFMQGHMPSFMTIPSLLVTEKLDGPVRGLIGLVAGLGAFVGPYLVGFIITKFGSMSAALTVIAAILTIGFLTAFALPKWLSYPKTVDANKSSTSV